MKKLVLCALLLASAVSCGQKSGYVIDGKAGNLNGSAALSYYNSDEEFVSDTVAMTGGSFRFTGEVKDAVRGTIYILPEGAENISASVIVENARLKVLLDLDDLIDYARYGGLVAAEPKITGGKNNEFWCGIKSMQKSKFADGKFAEIYAAEQEVTRMGYKDMDAYEAKSEELMKRFEDIIPDYEEALSKANIDYALSNPDVPAAAYLYYQNGRELPLIDMEEAFATFSPEVRESAFASDLAKTIESIKATAPGAPAIDFTLQDPDGNDITLSSLYGQYIILDFWASWCVPCREGMPAMKELYAKYHDKGLEILGISDDSDPEDWKQAIEEDGLPWLQTIDEFPVKNAPARVISAYGLHYIPSYFLIDKEGKFIGKFEHEELAAELAEIFDR